ncbi:SLC13 family permease [Pseudomonas sp. FSL R10-2398]|uniref:SLC13 family permease n=1 Tax=Pseudomonas sp. FSL R10-2398 TaxID=2662201 RepID=UPI001296C721|nr:SLC13 family permease [Pseudomonas sp. FSL R10-2398]MQT52668.1 transporter [Pseudomonas sp. FSL R10-2398]
MYTTLLIFFMVYLVMGVGKLPAFNVDRTGAAVVGALAMIVAGSLSPQAAWDAIDYRTLGLLFGLMVVSGAFTVSGFYAWAAEKVATLKITPVALLAVFIAVSAGLSSLLTNDVVVLSMTPLLVSVALARGLNPVPFLLAFCFAANAGAAGTLIGSPQNMIAAQALDLSFNEFMIAAGVPALLSLPIIWCIIAWQYRGKWTLERKTDKAVVHPPIQLDKVETTKAIIVASAVIIALVADIWPRELVALAGAGILLVNRSLASKDVLKQVDGNLLLLIIGLSICNQALANTGLPQSLFDWLRHVGIDVNDPISLFVAGSLLSDVVGNNPAVMLLSPYLHPDNNAQSLGAAIALGTGFSSNLIIFGSLAGIIVVEQAAGCGIKISFGSFAKSGVPVTLVTLLMAGLWIAFL